MKTDIAGRVKNTHLALSKPLLPVYEAITNSIESIQENKSKDGKITVEIIRDKENLLLNAEKSSAEINGFIIKDNGIGFNDQNYDAFVTSDTTRKASMGGKGIGRLMYLVAFNKATIESIYEEKGEFKKRKFDFVVNKLSILKAGSDTFFE